MRGREGEKEREEGGEEGAGKARLKELEELIDQFLRVGEEEREDVEISIGEDEEQKKIHKEREDKEIALAARQREIAQKEAKFQQRIEENQRKANAQKVKEKSKLEAAMQQIQQKQSECSKLRQQYAALTEHSKKTAEEHQKRQSSFREKQQELNITINQKDTQIAKLIEQTKANELQKLQMDRDYNSAKFKHENESKSIMEKATQEKQSLHQLLRQYQAKNQRLNAQIRILEATIHSKQEKIQELQNQQRETSKTLQERTANVEELRKRYEQKIDSEIDRVHKGYLAKIDTISQQNSKFLDQLKHNYDQSIQKQSKAHQEQVTKLKENIRQLQEEIEDINRRNDIRAERDNESYRSQNQSLVDILQSINLTVLGTAFKVVNNQQIVTLIEKKFNEFTAQVSSLQQSLNLAKQQHLQLQSQFKQVIRFFTIINVPLNNPEILENLTSFNTVKNGKFSFTNKELSSVISVFTKRLINRFGECKSVKDQIEREKGEAISENMGSLQKEKETAKARDQLEEKLKTLQEDHRQLIKQQKEREDKAMIAKIILQGQIKDLSEKVDKQNIELVSIRRQAEENSRTITSKDAELETAKQQNNSLQDKIAKEVTKNQSLSEELRSLTQKHKQVLISSETYKQESQRSISSLNEAISSLRDQKDKQKREQMAKINDFIVLNYDTREQLDSLDSFLHFLKSNQSSSDPIPFTVSHIFQRAAKYRQTFLTEAKAFLKSNISSTTLIYKYDQFNKNFSNYLPIKSSFPFLILTTTRQKQIFGILSTGLGKGSRSLAFNLNESRFFESTNNNASCSYQGGYLVFGQGEIRFRNNWNLQVIVNSRIFGARYFTFKKEELVGKGQEGDSVQLEAIEIHRVEY